jgi:type II secretory pathway pseudopilin PulG
MKNIEFQTLTRRPLTRPTKQAGLTLLEVIISLSIIATATIGLNAIADRFSDDTKNTVTASQIRTFGEATKAYIKDNYAAVQGVATATVPALIDAPTLIAAGKLPVGFLATNAFGQSMCALVLEPTANRLQAMVTTENGMAIDDLSMGNIASVIGGSGGAVYSSDTSIIRGAIGGWSISTATFDNLANNAGKRCDGSGGTVRLLAGHPTMALWFENGDTSSAFLARDTIPGRPELNAMNTPIVMNSVQVAGGSCPTVGAIAQDGAGGIVSCQAGVWKSPGDGKCVATSSDLNLLQTDGRCYNSAGNPNSPAGGDWFFLEVYRHTNPANYYTAQRVVGMTGVSVGRVWQRNQQSGSSGAGWAAWIQQADSQVAMGPGGTVTAAGAVTGGRIQSLGGSVGGAGQLYYDAAANMLAANTSIYSYGKICSQNTSGDCNGSGGTVISGGNISAAGSVNVAGNVSGGSLNSNGNTISSNGSTYNAANTWSLVGLDGSWGGNAQPQSSAGSAYVNDVYIRSTGKWASQLGGSTIDFAGAYYVYVGDGGRCPANTVTVGVGGFYASYTAGYMYCAPVY